MQSLHRLQLRRDNCQKLADKQQKAKEPVESIPRH